MALPERINGSARDFWNNVSRRAKAAFSPDNSGSFSNGDLEKQDKPNVQRRGSEPSLHKRFEALASSLSEFGGSIGNAIEEGFALVETKAANLISIKSPGRKAYKDSTVLPVHSPGDCDIIYMIGEDVLQLRASRDDAVEAAVKAKQEAKVLRAELAVMQERCIQLQAENGKLQELVERGRVQEEDDIVRMQLEAIHLEKTRLAKENESLARDNRFLKELMEFHQLSLEEISLDDTPTEEKSIE